MIGSKVPCFREHGFHVISILWTERRFSFRSIRSRFHIRNAFFLCNTFHVRHDLLDKGGRSWPFQLFPDGNGVDVLKVVTLFLSIEIVSLNELDDPALYP